MQPQTPAELAIAIKAEVRKAEDGFASDPDFTLIDAAIDDLCEKLMLVYCGEMELSPIDYLFGKHMMELLK